MNSLLDTQWERIGILRQALQAHKTAPAEERSLSLDVNGFHITLDGKIPVIGLAGGNGASDGIALTFRCGSPRADVRFGAWLSHLFLHATQRNAVSAVVQGKQCKDVKTHLLETPEPFDAVKELQSVLSVFLDGLRKVPPFTPESALAYVEKGTPDSEAMEAAKKQWFSGHAPLHSGDANPYFRAQLGEDGPFHEEAAFANLARQLLEPMLQAERKLEQGGA